MRIASFDPGKKGGCAVLDSQLGIVAAIPMPDGRGVFDFLVEHGPDYALLERTQSRPTDGRGGLHTFAYNAGIIEGIIIALSIPYQLISPQTWQRLMHKDTKANDTKKKSFEALARMFPHFECKATPRCTTQHDGMAEAILIASYGHRVMK